MIPADRTTDTCFMVEFLQGMLKRQYGQQGLQTGIDVAGVALVFEAGGRRERKRWGG